MKRNEWEFNYSANELAQAAAVKKGHHQQRREWWEAQKASVMQEVKDSGIEVSESLAAGYSTSNAGVGPQVMVRTDLQRKLSECHLKIREHSEKVDIYDGWAQVLAKNSTAMLLLHADDWLFFFRA